MALLGVDLSAYQTFKILLKYPAFRQFLIAVHFMAYKTEIFAITEKE